LVEALKLESIDAQKERSMPRTHVPYPPGFRAEAIRLVRASSKPVAEIARQLEVSHETLRAWIKQADIDDGLRHDGLTTEETEEVRQLRREVKRLREEREILVKAAAFFAQETGQTPR
jgi:transposase